MSEQFEVVYDGILIPLDELSESRDIGKLTEEIKLIKEILGQEIDNFESYTST